MGGVDVGTWPFYNFVFRMGKESPDKYCLFTFVPLLVKYMHYLIIFYPVKLLAFNFFPEYTFNSLKKSSLAHLIVFLSAASFSIFNHFKLTL